jgi:hypothetical protein
VLGVGNWTVGDLHVRAAEDASALPPPESRDHLLAGVSAAGVASVLAAAGAGFAAESAGFSDFLPTEKSLKDIYVNSLFLRKYIRFKYMVLNWV